MKVTFETNLNCGACVASVRPHLDAVEGVHRWDVDTSIDSKPLTVDCDSGVSGERIIEAVRLGGFEAKPAVVSSAGRSDLVTLDTPLGAHSAGRSDTKEPFRLSRYRPLLLVVTYIIVGCVYLENLAGGFETSRAMRHFMGLFFLGFAFFKLLDVSKFADAFATYDIIAHRVRGYALAYPFIELALGVAYMLNLFPLATNVMAAVIMGIGLVGVIDVVRKGQTIQCACLGTAFNLPMSAVTIIENSVMLLMALAAIFQIVG